MLKNQRHAGQLHDFRSNDYYGQNNRNVKTNNYPANEYQGKTNGDQNETANTQPSNFSLH